MIVDDSDIRVIKSTYNKKFREIIMDFLFSNKYVHSDLNRITKLHDFVIDKKSMEYKNNIENDRMSYGFTTFSKCFYDFTETNKFQSVYTNFLLSLYKTLGVDFYFQSFPNIRVHFPNKSAKETYPFYHTDRQLGHPPSEINLWMPLSDNKNCTFTILSHKDSLSNLKEIDYDYEKLADKSLLDKEWNRLCFEKSIHIDGESGICDNSSFCIFNNVRIHSVIPSETESRLSIDIRIVPVENFDFDNKFTGKGRVAAEWWPGGKSGYYSKSIGEIKNELD